jgi:hypothetical protein
MTRLLGKASQQGGGQPPHPRDLTLYGQNGWLYNHCTRAEDRATQGCDPSAASRAGKAGQLRLPLNPTYKFISQFEAQRGTANGAQRKLYWFF